MKNEEPFFFFFWPASCILPLCEQQSWALDINSKHRLNEGLLDCFFSSESLPVLRLHSAPQGSVVEHKQVINVKTALVSSAGLKREARNQWGGRKVVFFLET